MSKDKTDATEAEERIEALRAEIRRHDHLYYTEARPEISDQQYDALVRELRELEARHPHLITPDSPTQRVGERPLAGFEHVRHALPMLSIDNTYSPEELREFDQRVRKGLGDEPYEYLVDPKIDGVAVSLRFEQGRLTLGATRGDGRVGDDITQNVRAIRSVPLRLHGSGWPAVLEVRGEVYWPRPGFDETNRQRVASGEEAFKNPRNATAGTLKQLDSRVVADRGLAFLSHGFGQIEPPPIDVRRAAELFDLLREWGLPTSPHARQCGDIEEVLQFVVEWEWKRHQLDHETDGLVVKVSDLAQRDRLATTSKAPRWCIAYKYAAEQAQTRLISVDFQVGRSGAITPRATFDPVHLSGTTVTHATLHNFDQVRRLDLHVGDTLTVEKAGEIIPQVVAVDLARRPRDAKPVKPPGCCPECDGSVMQDDGGVRLRCINPACPAQLVERLIYFCGRNQMDIDVAGQVLIDKLVEQKLVRSYADLYRLHERAGELGEMPVSVNSRTGSPISLGGKRAAKLLEGLEASKRRPLARLLAALNIRHVGGNTAEVLAEHFGDMDGLAAADTDELQQVEGIGPEVAASLRAWFDSRAGQQTITDLKAVGVNMTQPRRRARPAVSPLAGKTVVVTGTLANYGRKQVEDRIRQLGGKPVGSISKSTGYLVVGDSPGSKLDKARALGVPILSESEFEALVRSAE